MFFATRFVAYGADYGRKDQTGTNSQRVEKAAWPDQVQAAEYAGVGLRFVRDLETGKKTLRMDKVNSLLYLFGLELGPVPVDRKSDNEIEK